MDTRPLWQRALEKRSRMRRVAELEATIVQRSIVRVQMRAPGVRCASCDRTGAVFGDPRIRPSCGRCWRAQLRAHAAVVKMRRELASLRKELADD